MTLVVAAEDPPLAAHATGVSPLGNSPVTLDTVVGLFGDGASAEEIAEQYLAIPPRPGLRSHRLLPGPYRRGG